MVATDDSRPLGLLSEPGRSRLRDSGVAEQGQGGELLAAWVWFLLKYDPGCFTTNHDAQVPTSLIVCFVNANFCLDCHAALVLILFYNLPQNHIAEPL